MPYKFSQSAVLGHIVPLRFLGMGFYLAWIYSVQFADTLSAGVNLLNLTTSTFFVSNLTSGVCLVACALLAKKISPLSEKIGVVVSAALSMALGTVLVFTGEHANLGLTAAVAGSGLAGLGLGLTILLWAEFFSGFSVREVGVYYSGSFLLALFIHLLIAGLPDVLSMIATSMLPLVSMAMLILSLHSHEPHRVSDPEAALAQFDRWTFPMRPVLLMAAYSFLFNFGRASGIGVSDLNMIGLGLVAAFVLIANLLFFERFDTRLLYKIAPPLMVFGLLIPYGSSGLSQIFAGVFLNASHAAFIILTMIILSGICYRYGVNPVWLFGLTRAARVGASVAGAYFGSFVAGWADPGTTIIVTSALASLLVLLSMLLLNENDLKTAWGISPIKHGVAQPLASYYERLVQRCSHIARVYGLTRREEEVLALLAQGMNGPRIEGELHISRGTAKGHVRHVYAKLGIHRREELTALVGMTNPPHLP